jgi:hypothetical protein
MRAAEWPDLLDLAAAWPLRVGCRYSVKLIPKVDLAIKVLIDASALICSRWG